MGAERSGDGYGNFSGNADVRYSVQQAAAKSDVSILGKEGENAR